MSIPTRFSLKPIACLRRTHDKLKGDQRHFIHLGPSYHRLCLISKIEEPVENVVFSEVQCASLPFSCQNLYQFDRLFRQLQ